MRTRVGGTRRWIAISVLGAVLAAAAACASPPVVPGPTPAAVTPVTPPDDWSTLLQAIPYPYSIPLPRPVPSAVDGTYVKIEPQEEDRVPCKRCPDYAIEGGTWKLYLHDGTFRILHEASGWRSLGSFTTFYDQNSAAQIDQLVLFNDPYCPGVVGLYNWRLEDGALVLEAVGDTCSMGLRAANMAHVPWPVCAAPNAEAGISDHWQKPPGCD